MLLWWLLFALFTFWCSNTPNTPPNSTAMYFSIYVHHQTTAWNFLLLNLLSCLPLTRPTHCPAILLLFAGISDLSSHSPDRWMRRKFSIASFCLATFPAVILLLTLPTSINFLRNASLQYDFLQINGAKYQRQVCKACRCQLYTSGILQHRFWQIRKLVEFFLRKIDWSP
jgi:hypothetical protein